jgi:hypothetical protein
MKHAPNATCTFTYPKVFKTLPEYIARSGQQVTVVRALTAEEADGPDNDCEQMYEVVAQDGFVMKAFESELT